MKVFLKIIQTLCFIFILSLLFPNSLSAQDLVNDTINLLDLSLRDLLNIKITTASKFEERLSDAPGMVSVISKDDLNRFGGQTLKDIFNKVPGLISATSYFPDRTIICSRGDQIRGNSGHILLLINGRPVREIVDGGDNSDMFESFPVSIIDRIEVIKGPGSVLYGSDAFSGIINIITGKNYDAGVKISGALGNKDIGAATLQINSKTDKFKFIFAAQILNNARWNYNLKAFNIISDNIISERINSCDKSKGLFAEVELNGFHITECYTYLNNWYRVNNPYNNGIFTNTTEKSFSNFGYHHLINKNWNIDFNITYTFSGLKCDSFPRLKRYSHDIVLELNNSFSIIDKAKFIVGGLFEYKEGTEYFSGLGTNIDDLNGNINNTGIYAQLDYSLLQNLNIIGGLQALKVENVKFKIIPRGGLIWHFRPEFNFKLLYSEAFRSASISELYLQNPILWGNPQIKPETVETIDAVLSYQNSNVLLSLSYFNSTFKNIIFRPELGEIYNTDKFIFKGTEFESKYYLNKNFYITGSFIYQTHKDTGDMALPVPKFGAKGGISFSKEKGLSLGLFDVYQGSPDKKFSNTINKAPGSYNILNFYSKFNILRFLKIPFVKDISGFLELQNLLNNIYYLPEWGAGYESSVPGTPGRVFYAGLNLNF
jgi:outer membrane receptor for ferrienterochelin and colicins